MPRPQKPLTPSRATLEQMGQATDVDRDLSHDPRVQGAYDAWRISTRHHAQRPLASSAPQGARPGVPAALRADGCGCCRRGAAVTERLWARSSWNWPVTSPAG